jgi:hypothetical protein
MNRTGQQGDAVSVDLIAEVLAGDADLGGSGGFQDIDIQVVPFLNGARVNRASSGHGSLVSTLVLLAFVQGVKAPPGPMGDCPIAIGCCDPPLPHEAIPPDRSGMRLPAL